MADVFRTLRGSAGLRRYPRAGERFSELIPGAGEQVRIGGAAHFLQEDRGGEIAERILEFVRG